MSKYLDLFLTHPLNTETTKETERFLNARGRELGDTRIIRIFPYFLKPSGSPGEQIGYQVIDSDNLGPLEDRVGDLLSKGWIAVGGVTVWSPKSSDEVKYYQAMVRYGSEVDSAI